MSAFADGPGEEGKTKSATLRPPIFANEIRKPRYRAFMIASALDTSKAPGASTFSALTTPLSMTIA